MQGIFWIDAFTKELEAHQVLSLQIYNSPSVASFVSFISFCQATCVSMLLIWITSHFLTNKESNLAFFFQVTKLTFLCNDLGSVSTTTIICNMEGVKANFRPEKMNCQEKSI